MDWEEFLQHPRVVKSVHSYEPGHYLFRKMLHDILHHLNDYKTLGWLAISTNTVSEDISNWFRRWLPKVEDWIAILTETSMQLHEAPPPDQDWQELIREIGKIPDQTTDILQSAETNSLFRGRDSDKIFARAIQSIRHLQSLRQLIQEDEYLLLLED